MPRLLNSTPLSDIWKEKKPFSKRKQSAKTTNEFSPSPISNNKTILHFEDNGSNSYGGSLFDEQVIAQLENAERCLEDSKKQPYVSPKSKETENQERLTSSLSDCSNKTIRGLKLSEWGLPEEVLQQYNRRGICRLFDWQVECLAVGKVLNGGSLVYSAPTSSGKTMVAEILMLKRVLEKKQKAIMILPFVSVAREKMFYLQGMFQDAGVRVDGYMGNHNPPGGFRRIDIAVCTIEKGNSLLNRLLEEGRLKTLGAVVVDEMHMLGDENRGYLLELLLTKLLYASKRIGHTIQIIGMSATLPNLGTLSSWLSADLYSTEFRPVPLSEYHKIGADLYEARTTTAIRRVGNDFASAKDDPDQVVTLCLETVASGHSVLVFCPTRQWCESLAEVVSKHAAKLASNESPENEIGSKLRNVRNNQGILDVLERLRRCPAGLDPILARTVAEGIAFHHAGLSFDERDIVEGAFRHGALKVLVATTTLSSGVNLPARRVIIRSPMSFGKVLDILTYKQMVGRAGRQGIDSKGESILLCKESERRQAAVLATGELKPVQSCLVKKAGKSLASSLKRAILEIISSGMASTPEEIELYMSCTLLAASLVDKEMIRSSVSNCLEYLVSEEFIYLNHEKDGDAKYLPSQLGKAVLASSLNPDEALVVFGELSKARKNFVLENEMHLIYQITPPYVSEQLGTLDWLNYLNLWSELPEDVKRVGELVGVEERFMARAIRGNPSGPKHAIHRRFYAALALNDLVHEVKLSEVSRKFACNRGVLQSLQQSASTFAGMVTAFCSKLGWNNMEKLVTQFQHRLHFGVQPELCDLVRLSSLNGQRARTLYDGGFETVLAVASASPLDIENLLKNSVPFKKCNSQTRAIWIYGKVGLNEREASRVIVDEAQSVIQKQFGSAAIRWCSSSANEPDLKMTQNIHNEKGTGETHGKKINSTDNLILIEDNKISLNKSPLVDKTNACDNNGNCVSPKTKTKARLSADSCVTETKVKEFPGQVDSANDFRRVLTKRSCNIGKETLNTVAAKFTRVKSFKKANLQSSTTPKIRGISEIHLTVSAKESEMPNTSSKNVERNEQNCKFSTSGKALNDEKTVSDQANVDCESFALSQDLFSQFGSNRDGLKTRRMRKSNATSSTGSEKFNVCSDKVEQNDKLPTSANDVNAEKSGSSKDSDSFASSQDLFSQTETNNSDRNRDAMPLSSSVLQEFCSSKWDSTSSSDNSDTIPPTPPKSASKATPFKTLNSRKHRYSSLPDLHEKFSPTPSKINRLESPFVVGRQTRSQTKLSLVGAAKDDILISSTPKAVILNGSSGSSSGSNSGEFVIVDVCADAGLFKSFSRDWRGKEEFSICVASQKIPRTDVVGIGAKINSVDAKTEFKPPSFCIEGDLYVIGIAISWQDKDAYYMSLQEPCNNCVSETGLGKDDSLSAAPNDPSLSIETKLELIRAVLGLDGRKIIVHDAVRQIRLLSSVLGVRLGAQNWMDPQIADWMLDPGSKRKTFQALVANCVPEHKDLIDVIDEYKRRKSKCRERVQASAEVVLSFHTTKCLLAKLDDLGMKQFFLETEMPLVQTVAVLEECGIGFDGRKCGKCLMQLQESLRKLEKEAHLLAQRPFNLLSVNEVSRILYKELRLGSDSTWKKDTSKSSLEKLKREHRLPGVIMEWRKVSCTLTKTVLPITKAKCFCHVLGMHRIRATYDTHTSTGRVVTCWPNLQAVNREFDLSGSSQESVNLRDCFVSAKGCVFLSADYSQLELRILAYLSGDPKLLRSLNNGCDIFISVAADTNKIPASCVTDAQRQQAKQLCYGIIYGMGVRALSEQLEVDEDQAFVFMDSFKSTYRGVKDYVAKVIRDCIETGYVSSLSGRRRYLPSITSKNASSRSAAERQAVNTTIQGSAADLVKMATVAIYRELRKTFAPGALRCDTKIGGAQLVLQLHDELIYEVEEAHASIVAEIVCRNMEGVAPRGVKLPVKLKSGSSWGSLATIPR